MKCPDDTRTLITQSSVQISNFALRYRYFLDGSLGSRGRIGFGLNQAQTPEPVPSLKSSEIEPLRNRQKEQLRYLAPDGHFYCATSQLDWRMVVGLGSNHVQETNMTLDHVHGIPYLPGSAIKGIVRSWVIQEYFTDEEEATRDFQIGDSVALRQKKENFFTVFGSQKCAGQVQFLDALPNSHVHFNIDIMNPHFPDYYTGSDFPTDFQRLIQIYFLTLRNTHFRFLIAAKEAGPLQLARDWFTEAIANRGLGAKSAVGYGHFRELNDKTDELKYEFAEKLSLEDAYDIYRDKPAQRDDIYIDLKPLVDYFPKFAFIITEDICEIENIGDIDDIPELLIEADAGIVIPSEFGKWVYEKTKDKLFERELPTFPNLIYRSRFNTDFAHLSLDQRKLLQEKLLQIAIDSYQVINSNLPQNERSLLAERLIQIATELESGEVRINLSSDERKMFAEKLFESAVGLEDQTAIPESIDVEGGRTIICGGLENGNLILRRYTNQ